LKYSDLRGGDTQSSFKEAVSKLEIIVEELKTLPPDRLESAADYIHRLRTISLAERAAILKRTAGSLTPEEGDELARIIEEGCERIDEHDW
jgi:hypothetical protein